MSVVSRVRGPVERDLERLIKELREEAPDEVLVVYIKGSNVSTLSTGTFSRLRTLGALQWLIHDVMKPRE